MADSSSTSRSGTYIFRQTELVITWPDGTRQTYTISQDIVRVGRGEENNDISAPEAFNSVSRKHFEIRRSGAIYRLVDLGSVNGVFVNGERIESDAVLMDGDEIQFGSESLSQLVRITFQMGIDPAGFEIDAEPKEEASTLADYLDREPVGIPYLKIRWPKGNVNYFTLKEKKTLIGRDSECALQIPPRLRFVSGQHAEIQRTDRGFFIRDLNSANGTRLNNHSLLPNEPTSLADGSMIRHFYRAEFSQPGRSKTSTEGFFSCSY
jgi:pSer/pThr/pTyr-binding forkhead associated (FHA) protein